MGLGSGYLMEFPLPVPARCRASGNGNRVGRGRLWFSSDAVSNAIAVKVTGGGQGSQTLAEGSLANATQRPQL